MEHSRWRTDTDFRVGRYAPRGEQQIRVRQLSGNRETPHHPSMVRRHAASVGVQAGLASRTVPDRSGYGLRRRGRRRLVSLYRRWADVAGACLTAQLKRATLATRRRRALPATDYAVTNRSTN